MVFILPDMCLVLVLSTTETHLGNFGMQALTHLYPPMGHQHCAICVNMQQGARLVQELGGEGDAKLGGNDCYAPLAEPVGFVEVFGLLQPLSKTCLANDAAPAGLQCM